MKTDLSLLLSVCIKKVESRLQTAFLRNLFMVKLLLVTSKTHKAAKYCTELRQQTQGTPSSLKKTRGHILKSNFKLDYVSYTRGEVSFITPHINQNETIQTNKDKILYKYSVITTA